MAKSTQKPLHQGGRTLARMGKKPGSSGGKKKKRGVWYADGSGELFGAPWKPPAYPEGEHPIKVMKVTKQMAAAAK
jgi:hypothetical protein